MEKASDCRKDNPGLGCARLYLIIKGLFESAGCMPGRDAFIELLRKNGLMVQIKRRRRYKKRLYKMKMPTIEECKEEMKRIILFHNTGRAHVSIGNKTPGVVYGETGEQKRCWRNPWDKPVETLTP